MRYPALLATLLLSASFQFFCPPVTTDAAESSAPVAVGPQYDTAHVYVAPEDVDRLVASFLATFGGKAVRRQHL
jgi:hypothetical protein